MLQNRESFSVKNVLNDFHVSSENELQDRLMNDDNWHITKCCVCQENVSLLDCRFLGGDPCHVKCK